MARAPQVIIPDTVDPEVMDAIDEEDAEQAAVGTLFSIQGPEFDGIEWAVHRYLTRQELAQSQSANKYEWVADITGELHGADLVSQVGGGTFRFFGQINRADGKGKRVVHNRKVTIAGPRKNFAYEPPPTPPTANGVSPDLAAVLAGQQKLLERIEQRMAAPPQAVVDPITQMAAMMGAMGAMIKGVMEMVPKPVAQVIPNPGPTPIKEVMEAVNLGISLQQNAGGGTESDGIAIAKMVMPAITRLGEAVLSRRAPPSPPRTTRPAEAEVIEPEPVPTPAAAAAAPASNPTEDPNAEASARWTTLLGSLARAIGERREPGDFAGSVEDIMLPDEIELFKSATAEQVTAELRATAGNRYPVLATPQAQEYIAAVLVELRQPSYEDPA